MAERKTLTIATDGSAMYRTLIEAVQVCTADPQAPVRFYLKRGVYAERPFIELADYVLEGEDRDKTILTAGVGVTRGPVRKRQGRSAPGRCS